MLSPLTKPSETELFGIAFLDSLYRYALVLTRRHTEAEDLVQETYVRAIEAYGRLREDSNIKAWLFTILRNQWFNELRRRRSAPQFAEADGEHSVVDALPSNASGAQEMMESHENALMVREALSKLPPEFQEVLILREFEELSYQEIASVLNCPAGTVMSRLGRARSKLRAALVEFGDAAFSERKKA
ncbi:RNA polymerase sigma factor [Silvibacterium acidisoli]|uniref:RNA polymerase sigma factor n=1 Tax=Acidobacteriaceae bacterium ZG23-2 TaxID=2883246 RepID=UPI00406D1D82